jgi:hypothetical protein
VDAEMDGGRQFAKLVDLPEVLRFLGQDTFVVNTFIALNDTHEGIHKQM